MTPLNWADSLAKEVAERMEKEVVKGAEKDRNLYPREELEKVGRVAKGGWGWTLSALKGPRSSAVSVPQAPEAESLSNPLP